MLNMRALLKDFRARKVIPELWGELTWLRCRYLEGTLDKGPSYGCWGITDLRVQFGTGTPFKPEHDYLRQQAWPPIIPKSTIGESLGNRITAYRRVRSSSECVTFLSRHDPVNAGFAISGDWLTEETKESGEIPASPRLPVIGAHAVSLFSADPLKRSFEIDNTMWEDWGKEGFGHLPYSVFDQQLIEAYTIGGIGKSLGGLSGSVLGTPLGYKFSPHGMVVFNTTDDIERFGWAMFSENDRAIHVDDIYVKPEYRRRGWGTKLLNKLIEVSLTYEKPLVFWVPFADCDPAHLIVISRFFGRHGFTLTPSPERWAGCVAKLSWLATPVPTIFVPERPALDIASALKAFTAAAVLAATPIAPIEGTGPDTSTILAVAHSDFQEPISGAFPSPDTANWGEMNRRRADLIRRDIAGTLGVAERQELEYLQRESLAALDEAFPEPDLDEEWERVLDERLGHHEEAG